MITQSLYKWRKNPIVLGLLVGLIGGGSYILLNRTSNDEVLGQSPTNLEQTDQTLSLDKLAQEEGQLPAMIAEKD